ncbi:hypothetical protein BJ956_001766 [Arthrobacter psychrochitiniphilus]|nr:hypothetical protein [Arthrobacter psychrochitiniphilus]
MVMGSVWTHNPGTHKQRPRSLTHLVLVESPTDTNPFKEPEACITTASSPRRPVPGSSLAATEVHKEWSTSHCAALRATHRERPC